MVVPKTVLQKPYTWEILASKDIKLIHNNVHAKLNKQNENSVAIKIALECLEGYMIDIGIKIPEYENLQK